MENGGGNKYHEDLLFKIYGEEKIIQLISEKSDSGNRGKEILENPYIRMSRTRSGANRVYLLGRCIVYGMGCITEEQLSSKLQKYIDASAYDYEVVSVGIDEDNIKNVRDIVLSLPIRQGDVFCIIDEDVLGALYFGREAENNPMLNIYKVPERPDYFFGCPIHSTPQGNEALARFIFENDLEPLLRKKVVEENLGEYIQKGEIISFNTFEIIKKYIRRVRRGTPEGSSVGAIVMNANPFTFGHRYLAEYASGMVDYLYVFVVEENKSEISFKDRFGFVQKGLADIENIAVVPSGSMIISQKTLSVYFQKDEYQNKRIDMSYDAEIFARYIAPPLKIVMRFVGEEPTDNVTAQYNKQMKKVFSRFGLKLVEIPRKETDTGEIISASLLRKALRNGDYEYARKFVDESELSELIKLYEE